MKVDVYRLYVSGERLEAVRNELDGPHEVIARRDTGDGELVEIEVWGNATAPWPLILGPRLVAARRLRRLARRHHVVLLRYRPDLLNYPPG